MTSDGFIRAVVLSKQSVVLPEGENLNKLMESVLRKERSDVSKPDRPEELQHMCNCIDVSSAKLRKRD